MKNSLVAVMAAIALAGCASTSSVTPQSAVFAAKSSYAVALQGAVAYKRLPVCATPPVLPCSDPAMVTRLQKADNAAAATLDAAEVSVRSGGSASVRDQAVTAAKAAVAAFLELVKHTGGAK